MKGGLYEVKGRGAPWMVRFGKISRRFKSKELAERFLTGLRFKTDEGTFDPRDYSKDNPLGFETLANQWLDRQYKRGLKCPQHKKLHIKKAINHFGNRNIKTIGYGELDDFLLEISHGYSEKYRHDIMENIRQFLKWVAKRDKYYEMPDVPRILNPTMRMRQTVDKVTQTAILEEIKRLTWAMNPKIYVACLWLSTYIEVRPVELLDIKEGDINLSLGIIEIRHDKTGDESGKKIYLIDEDVDIIKSFPAAMPHLYFFRHHKSWEGMSPTLIGHKFGKTILYKWWKKACQNLGVEGVSLYPGTRHSSVTELGQYYSPEEVMGGSAHKTSKAFMRYFSVKADKRRQVSLKARGETNVKRLNSPLKTVSA